MNNNNNNNNQPKAVGYPTHFMNAGVMAGPVQPKPPNPQPQSHHHLLSQSHTGPPHFPGHFQLSEPQVHALAQSQFVSAQAQANAQAAQAQFQAQLQAQAQAQLHAQAQAQSAAPTPPVPTPPGPAKRTNPRHPTRAPSSSSNPSNPNSPFKTMELAPAPARPKKRGRSDPRTLPEKLAPILPESALYTQLLEYEARLDTAVARQKADIHESLKLPPQVQRILRIYIFNTFSASPDPPGWSLRIVGRLLEDGKDPAVMSQNPNPQPKFSTFFKKIMIQLDRTLYPDDSMILWESSRSSAHHEGFEVKRKGDKEFRAVIRLEMNYSPEKFKLSPALSMALGIEVDTRARIMAAIWNYVKARKLQVPTDPASFICDPFLHKVFGEERMKFAAVSVKLSQHLTPPDPICLEHEIKLSGVSPAGTICYDVVVDMPLQINSEIARFLSICDKSKEIDHYDELISSSIKKIVEHRRRRAFFLGFSQSPAEFINTLIASQSKDLKLVSGDGGVRYVDKENISEFYNQPWVEDAVIRYLNRKAAGTDAPGTT